MPILRVRVRHELQGGHVHMGVWSNIVQKTGYDHGETLAKCGDLVMTEAEFQMFRAALGRHHIGPIEFQFIEKQGGE
jgi:hypothetical protein